MKPLLPVSIAIAISLSYIDIHYMAVFASSDILQLASGLELFIFWLQVGKVGAIILVPRLRNARTSLLVDIFGAEILILPVLAVTSVYLGSGKIPVVALELFKGWVV